VIMELQVVLPDESSTMPVRTLVELARAADDLGYRTAYLPDHILPPGEYGATFGGYYEPLVTIGHLAAVTERIRFGTSVLVLPLRNPFVLAKQVATLQELSAGRMLLGVGVGWVKQEYAAVGVEFGHRGAITDDALAVIRHLFAGGSAPYQDRRYGYDIGVFGPLPTVQVPILVGGNSDAALRRAARYGELWQALPMMPAQLAERIGVLTAMSGDRVVSPGIRIQWDDGRPVGQVADEVAGYADAGAEHVAVHFGDIDGSAGRMTALAESLDWAR
jgi:probable F420-dependent oxidoreductase